MDRLRRSFRGSTQSENNKRQNSKQKPGIKSSTPVTKCVSGTSPGTRVSASVQNRKMNVGVNTRAREIEEVVAAMEEEEERASMSSYSSAGMMKTTVRTRSRQSMASSSATASTGGATGTTKSVSTTSTASAGNKSGPGGRTGGVESPPWPSFDHDYEREDVQRKSFGKWMNSQLLKGGYSLVRDLYHDLKDGTKLLELLEVLSGESFKREKGNLRVHHLNNVNKALQILESNNVKIVNISNQDIVDGNPKLILGLLWQIISHWQLKDVLKQMTPSAANRVPLTDLEKALLAWCRYSTQDCPEVDIRNFTTSWTNGLAFCAVIARWKPDILDYSHCLRNLDALQRLDTAFQTAFRHLKIPKLLDPEDVYTAVPDKKSVMMYVMCLFQSLPHSMVDFSAMSDFMPPEEPVIDEPMDEGDVGSENEDGGSRPLSLSSSIDMSSYQAVMEEVLAWLLEAEDRLGQLGDIGDSLVDVRDQFQEHEEFMVELSREETSVGALLQEGNSLITDGKLSSEEEEEIRVQVKLLSSRWEELRVQAMDRQSKLQECLMSMQQLELARLRAWLTDAEDRVSRQMETQPADFAGIMQQLHDHQDLQERVSAMQPTVNILSNMVVVVDDNTAEAEYSGLEDELAMVGERWTFVCHWVETRGAMLQELVKEWTKFEEGWSKVENWLHTQDRGLYELEARVKPDSVHRTIKFLEDVERNMDLEKERLLSIRASAEAVVLKLGGSTTADTPNNNSRLAAPTAGIGILGQLEQLEKRWEDFAGRVKTIRMEAAEMNLPSPKEESQARKHELEDVDKYEAKRTRYSSKTSDEVDAVDPWTLCHEEFKNKLKEFHGWLQSVAVNIRPEAGAEADLPPSFRDLSSKQAWAKHEELEAEIGGRHMDYVDLKILGDRTMELAEEDDAFQDVEKDLKNLSNDWENALVVMARLKEKLKTKDVVKERESEIARVDRQVAAIAREFDEDFGKYFTLDGGLNSSVVATCSPEQIDGLKADLKARLEAMKGSGDLAKTVVDQSIAGSDPAAVREAAQKVLMAWKDCHLKAEQLLKAATTTTPGTPGRARSVDSGIPGENQIPEKYKEALTAFDRWLSQAEETFRGSQFDQMQDEDTMKELLAKLLVFDREIQSQEESWLFVQERGDKIVSASGNPWLTKKLESLEKRWGDLKNNSAGCLHRVEKDLGELCQLQEEMEGLESWMKEVNVFLSSEDTAYGDVEMLEAQLEQNVGLGDDIKTLETSMDGVKETATKMKARGSTEFQAWMQAKIDVLEAAWRQVVNDARVQEQVLTEALEQTKKVMTGLRGFCDWLDATEARMPDIVGDADEGKDSNSTLPVEKPEDFARLLKELQGVRDGAHERRMELDRLSQTVGGIFVKAKMTVRGGADGEDVEENGEDADRRTGALQEKLKSVQSRMEQLTSVLDARFRRLKESSQAYGSFRILYGQEMDWLSRLERILDKRHPNAAADAEEISEDLDDLENFLNNRDHDRVAEIHALAESIGGSERLLAIVNGQLDALDARWNRLRQRAEERQRILEGSIVEAQELERSILMCQEWTTSSDAILTRRLQADIFVSDIPEDHQHMKNEFEDYELRIKDLDDAVERYTSVGKMEAAARLTEQLKLIKDRFSDAKTKLIMFETLSELEPKIHQLSRVIHDTQEGLYLAELTSDDPEMIQGHLNHCMRLFRDLNEVTPEVQRIARDCKGAIEKKQVPSPEGLEDKIGLIQNLFQELGQKVHETRECLEAALKISQSLHDDRVKIESWLDKTETELDEREATIPPKDINAEAEFAQNALEEMTKLKSKYTAIKEGYISLMKLSERNSASVQLFRDRWSLFDRQWSRLQTRLNTRVASMKGALKNSDLLLKEFQGCANALETWLANATEAVSKENRQKLKALHCAVPEMKSKLNCMRDAAVEAIAMGTPVQDEVQASLASINRSWEEILPQVEWEKEDLQDRTEEKSSSSDTTEPTVVVNLTRNSLPSAQQASLEVIESSGRESRSSDGSMSRVLRNRNQRHSPRNTTPSSVSSRASSADERLSGDGSGGTDDGRKMAFKSQASLDTLSRTSSIDPDVCMAEEPVVEAAIAPVQAVQEQEVEVRTTNEAELRSKVGDLERNLKTICDAFAQSGASSARLRELTAKVKKVRAEFDSLKAEASPKLLSADESRALESRVREVENLAKIYVKPDLIRDTQGGLKVVIGEKEEALAVLQALRDLHDELEIQRPLGLKNRKPFDDFPAQEGALKSIKHRIDDMKTTVESLNVKLVAMQVKAAGDASKDGGFSLSQEVNEAWDKLQRKYEERFQAFSVSRVTWDNHKSLSEQLDSWLRKVYSSGELAMAQKQKTANDDDLSAALAAQKDLERQVTDHHRLVTELIQTGTEISSGSSAGGTGIALVREREATLVSRWRSLLSELAGNRDRLLGLEEKLGRYRVEATETMATIGAWLAHSQGMLDQSWESPDYKGIQDNVRKLQAREREMKSLAYKLESIKQNAEEKDYKDLTERMEKLKASLASDLQNLKMRAVRLEKMSDLMKKLNYWFQGATNRLRRPSLTSDSCKKLDEEKEERKKELEELEAVANRLSTEGGGSVPALFKERMAEVQERFAELTKNITTANETGLPLDVSSPTPPPASPNPTSPTPVKSPRHPFGSVPSPFVARPPMSPMSTHIVDDSIFDESSVSISLSPISSPVSTSASTPTSPLSPLLSPGKSKEPPVVPAKPLRGPRGPLANSTALVASLPGASGLSSPKDVVGSPKEEVTSARVRYIPIQREDSMEKAKKLPEVKPTRPQFEWSIVNLRSLQGPTSVTRARVSKEETTKTDPINTGSVQKVTVLERTLAETCVSPVLKDFTDGIAETPTKRAITDSGTVATGEPSVCANTPSASTDTAAASSPPSATSSTPVPGREERKAQEPLSVQIAASAGATPKPSASLSTSSTPQLSPSLADQLANLNNSVHQIKDWLEVVDTMLRQQPVTVGNVEEIAVQAEKQENVLKELEQKKPQLEELVSTAESLKSHANRQQLHGKVTRLKEHWEETRSRVEARRRELNDMLAVSRRWDAVRRDATNWLDAMERRSHQLGPVAHSMDALEAQLKEQKTFHGELHQNRPKLDQFNQLSQELIDTHPNDDTRFVKKITEQLNHRYGVLNSGAVSRGKALHTAVSSLHSWDKTVDKFLAWLGEAQSTLACVENDSDAARAVKQFRDLQAEIDSHKDTHASLAATGFKIQQSLESPEEAAAVSQRLNEVDAKWNGLKDKSASVRAKLESNGAEPQQAGVGPTSEQQQQQLPPSNVQQQQSGEKWTTLLMSLRELIEWVVRKDGELTSIAHVLADIPCLHRQQEDLRAFRRELEGRAPVIESNLSTGRNYLANDHSITDGSDTEEFGSIYEAKEPARVARRELKKLSEKWSSLNARLDVMQQRNNDLQAKTHKLQHTVDEAHQRLAQAESAINRWVALQDPGRADELMNEVTRMREQMGPLRKVVDEAREQSNRLQGATVSMTPHMLNRLKDIQARWAQVDRAVDDRWRRMSLSDSLRRDRQVERDLRVKRPGRAASEDGRALPSRREQLGLGRSGMLSGATGDDEDDDGGFKTASLRRFGSGGAGSTGGTVADRLREKFNGGKMLTTSQGSLSQAFLSSATEYPWERGVHNNHVPYYINHNNKTTQWDHPIMSEVMDKLSDLNHVKYSAYRTAMKLRILQKRICLDLVSHSTVVEACDAHGLRAQNDKLITVPEMAALLHSMYQRAASDAPAEIAPSFNPVLNTDLCLNYLLNAYDSARNGHIRVLSFKVGVTLLSRGHVDEKFRYLFRLIADPSRQVDQRKLGLLLHDCLAIPRMLGEAAAFGGADVEPSVSSCFSVHVAKSRLLSGAASAATLPPGHTGSLPGHGTAPPRDTIEIAHFLTWVKQEPQTLVWVPVLHRLAASETAKHQAKCNVCREYPIVGFRYRCLKCFNFDMCQSCFFSGRSSKHHKASHPMQEYCTATTSGEDVRDFTRTLRNKFKSKRYFRKHPRMGYLPVQGDGSTKPPSGASAAATPSGSSRKDGASSSMGMAGFSSAAESDGGSRDGSPVASPRPSGALSNNSAGASATGSSNQSPATPLPPAEVHSRLEMYASRLAEVEQRSHTSPVTDSEDEHALISRYCQSLGHLRREDVPSSMSADAGRVNHLPPSGVGSARGRGTVPNTNGSAGGRHHRQGSASLPPGDIPSPTEVLTALETGHQGELALMISELEAENQALQEEYDRLRARSSNPGSMYGSYGSGLGQQYGGRGGGPYSTMGGSYDMSNSMITSPSPGSECGDLSSSRLNGEPVPSEDDIVAEARYLKEHRGRLENRMKFLEDQNSLLEMQMQRLKGVLDQPAGYAGTNYPNMSKSGTLQSRHVTASQLATDSPHGMNGGAGVGEMRRLGLMEDDYRPEAMDVLNRRPQPPPHSSKLGDSSSAATGGGSVEDLFAKCGDVGKAVEGLVSALRSDDLDS